MMIKMQCNILSTNEMHLPYKRHLNDAHIHLFCICSRVKYELTTNCETTPHPIKSLPRSNDGLENE